MDNASCLAKARSVLPGGVNSPVRAFGQVGGEPFFVARGEGAWLIDVEGRRYVDYIGSWGPLIVGHAHPEVVAAVARAAADGMSFGAPSPLEYELAAAIRELVPSVEMLRLVSSGTEACMSAIRLARAATGRSRILKFDGCYHGHADSFLVRAGSGVATLGLPNSPGVPEALAGLTTSLPFNDLDAVRAAFGRAGREIAAVIVEPVPGNMNLVLPESGFLEGLRALCDAHETLLIFDEVMSGFRVALGGAQALYPVRPDLSCFGKVIGAGMPVAAYGGRAELMRRIAPLGPVYQAGTLSGNPVAMAAGLANLRLIREPGFFDRLAGLTRELCAGLEAAAASAGVTFSTNHLGGMFGMHFRSTPPRDFAEAGAADIDLFRRFFHACLRRGVYFAPSAFEAGFVSAAHTGEPLAHTLAVAHEAFAEVAAGR